MNSVINQVIKLSDINSIKERLNNFQSLDNPGMSYFFRTLKDKFEKYFLLLIPARFNNMDHYTHKDLSIQASPSYRHQSYKTICQPDMEECQFDIWVYNSYYKLTKNDLFKIKNIIENTSAYSDLVNYMQDISKNCNNKLIFSDLRLKNEDGESLEYTFNIYFKINYNNFKSSNLMKKLYQIEEISVNDYLNDITQFSHSNKSNFGFIYPSDIFKLSVQPRMLKFDCDELAYSSTDDDYDNEIDDYNDETLLNYIGRPEQDYWEKEQEDIEDYRYTYDKIDVLTIKFYLGVKWYTEFCKLNNIRPVKDPYNYKQYRNLIFAMIKYNSDNLSNWPEQKELDDYYRPEDPDEPDNDYDY